MKAAPVHTSRPIAAESLDSDGDLPILDLVGLILARWRIVVGAAVLAGLATAMYSLFLRPVYTASTTFMPEQPGQAALPAGLASLAGQFGAVIGGSSGQSPRVYAVILMSRGVADQVLTARFPTRGNERADSVTLLDLLAIDGDSRSIRLERGEKTLSSRLTVAVDNLTGVVRVSFDSPDPVISANVANKFVDVLNEFNTLARHSSAQDRSRFIEERRAEAEQSLRDAEGQLRRFYEGNRSWQLSPELIVEEGRLRRQVDLRQEVYVTLAREYERTQIERENNVNAITVIDRAVPPLVRSAPKRRMMVSIAVLLGGLMGVAWIFFGSYVEDARRSRGQDFLRLPSIKGTLRRVWRTSDRPPSDAKV